jgi:hypothetical protein
MGLGCRKRPSELEVIFLGAPRRGGGFRIGFRFAEVKVLLIGARHSKVGLSEPIRRAERACRAGG